MTASATTLPRRLSYAGIGARRTPPSVLADMTRIAQWLHRTGWHLNSGGAAGADRAFADGASPDSRTLFLPWPGYNGHAGADCRTHVARRAQARPGIRRITASGLGALFPGRPGAPCPHAAIVLGAGLERHVDAWFAGRRTASLSAAPGSPCSWRGWRACPC